MLRWFFRAAELVAFAGIAAVAGNAPVAAQVSAGAAAQVSAGAAAPEASSTDPALASHAIVGDGIPAALNGAVGDMARGRAIVADRRIGLCLLCHAAPIPEQRFQGNLGPNLDGVGARWSVAQLRLRLVDARRLNPASIMPSYYRVEGLARVAPALRGKPILSAQQIEDVVAYLASLQANDGNPTVLPTLTNKAPHD